MSYWTCVYFLDYEELPWVLPGTNERLAAPPVRVSSGALARLMGVLFSDWYFGLRAVGRHEYQPLHRECHIIVFVQVHGTSR